jgi:hypothetical protein
MNRAMNRAMKRTIRRHMTRAMRHVSIATAAALLALCAFATSPAAADPYRWCAVYGTSGSDNGTNCYFMTIGQCQATVSGIGGFCTPNNFYDGRPVTTPGEAPRSRNRATR